MKQGHIKERAEALHSALPLDTVDWLGQVQSRFKALAGRQASLEVHTACQCVSPSINLALRSLTQQQEHLTRAFSETFLLHRGEGEKLASEGL